VVCSVKVLAFNFSSRVVLVSQQTEASEVVHFFPAQFVESLASIKLPVNSSPLQITDISKSASSSNLKESLSLMLVHFARDAAAFAFKIASVAVAFRHGFFRS
tara:strand:+ start:1046 stop:1354 length:309 start_codon:yes stop_codon:yes gene_type:complete